MEQMTTISAIKLMPYSKDERAKFIQLTVDELLSGNYSVEQIAEIFVALKSIEETVKAIQSNGDVREYLEDLMHGKEIELNGASITISERKSFTYDSDIRWCELEQKIQALKDEQKKLEGLMKAIKAPVADAETGELIQPARWTASKVFTVKIK